MGLTTARIWVLALGLLFFCLMGGCGGDESAETADGSQEPSSGPLTTATFDKAAYIERANALCDRNAEKQMTELTAYAEEHPDETEVERLEGAIDEVYVPVMEERLEELRELGAPRGDAKELEETFAAFQDMIDAASQSGATSPAYAKQSTRVRNLLEAYGLDECDV